MSEGLPTYESERDKHRANLASAEQSLQCAMSAYGGLHPNNDREREHLAKCLEAVSAALTTRAAFERLVAAQVRR